MQCLFPFSLSSSSSFDFCNDIKCSSIFFTLTLRQRRPIGGAAVSRDSVRISAFHRCLYHTSSFSSEPRGRKEQEKKYLFYYSLSFYFFLLFLVCGCIRPHCFACGCMHSHHPHCGNMHPHASASFRMWPAQLFHPPAAEVDRERGGSARCRPYLWFHICLYHSSSFSSWWTTGEEGAGEEVFIFIIRFLFISFFFFFFLYTDVYDRIVSYTGVYGRITS